MRKMYASNNSVRERPVMRQRVVLAMLHQMPALANRLFHMKESALTYKNG